MFLAPWDIPGSMALPHPQGASLLLESAGRPEQGEVGLEGPAQVSSWRQRSPALHPTCSSLGDSGGTEGCLRTVLPSCWPQNVCPESIGVSSGQHSTLFVLFQGLREPQDLWEDEHINGLASGALSSLGLPASGKWQGEDVRCF